MKKLMAALAALVLMVSVAYGLGIRPSGNSGDRKLDGTLEKITLEAGDDHDGFLDQLGASLNLPEPELRQARDRYGLATNDLYMAAALAKASGRPVLNVAEDYRKDPGKGWGVMAKDMGIKPGSREFQHMKDGADRFLGDMEARHKADREHEPGNMDKEHKSKNEPQGKGHKSP